MAEAIRAAPRSSNNDHLLSTDAVDDYSSCDDIVFVSREGVEARSSEVQSRMKGYRCSLVGINTLRH